MTWLVSLLFRQLDPIAHLIELVVNQFGARKYLQEKCISKSLGSMVYQFGHEASALPSRSISGCSDKSTGFMANLVHHTTLRLRDDYFWRFLSVSNWLAIKTLGWAIGPNCRIVSLTDSVTSPHNSKSLNLSLPKVGGLGVQPHITILIELTNNTELFWVGECPTRSSISKCWKLRLLKWRLTSFFGVPNAAQEIDWKNKHLHYIVSLNPYVAMLQCQKTTRSNPWPIHSMIWLVNSPNLNW